MYVYLNRLAIDRHTRWVFAYKFSGVSKFIKGSRVVWEMAGKRKWVKEWQAFNPVMSVIKPRIVIASKAIDRYVYILKTFNTFNSVEYICIFFEPMLRRLSFVHLYLSPFDTVVIVVYRTYTCLLSENGSMSLFVWWKRTAGWRLKSNFEVGYAHIHISILTFIGHPR